MKVVDAVPDFLDRFPSLEVFLQSARFHAGHTYTGDMIPARSNAPTFFGPDLSVAQYAYDLADPMLYVVTRDDLHPVAGMPFAVGPIVAVRHEVPILAHVNPMVANGLSRRALYAEIVTALDQQLTRDGI